MAVNVDCFVTPGFDTGYVLLYFSDFVHSTIYGGMGINASPCFESHTRIRHKPKLATNLLINDTKRQEKES